MNLIESLIAVTLLAFISCTATENFVVICQRTKHDFFKSRDAVNDYSMRQEHRSAE